MGGRALANTLYAATNLTHLNLQQQLDLCDELLRVVSPVLLSLAFGYSQPIHDVHTQYTMCSNM